MDQISRQAITDAKAQLARALKGATDVKIVGEPEVTAVHADLKDIANRPPKSGV